ncbi:MAG: Stage 0 sporulation A-like protein [Succiniclasticum sp.]|jgi:DNA-binding response OmpR family regulator
MGRILIADDNVQITNILVEYAKREGHPCYVAHDGEEALALFARYERDIDIVLLDVMMPKLDGYEVCRSIRKKSTVPIIMITARGEDSDKILGLDTGADDYMVKPFSPAEVMARIRAILRRIPKEEKQVRTIRTANLFIDIDNYLVTIDGQEVHLTKREKELLWLLASNPTKVFSRDNLLDSLWGYDYYGDSRTVDSHIKRLRAKLEEYPHPQWNIKTIWGVGYRFELEPPAGTPAAPQE